MSTISPFPCIYINYLEILLLLTIFFEEAEVWGLPWVQDKLGIHSKTYLCIKKIHLFMTSEYYFQSCLSMLFIITNNSMFLQIHLLVPRTSRNDMLQKLPKPCHPSLCPVAKLTKATLLLSVVSPGASGVFQRSLPSLLPTCTALTQYQCV